MSEAAANETAARQRIEKWLWFARLVKTRSQAQRLVAAGQVRVNRSRLNKASQTVSRGDVVAVIVHDRVWVIRVEQAGQRRGPAPQARLLYTDLSAGANSRPAQAATAQTSDLPA